MQEMVGGRAGREDAGLLGLGIYRKGCRGPVVRLHGDTNTGSWARTGARRCRAFIPWVGFPGEFEDVEVSRDGVNNNITQLGAIAKGASAPQLEILRLVFLMRPLGMGRTWGSVTRCRSSMCLAWHDAHCGSCMKLIGVPCNIVSRYCTLQQSPKVYTPNGFLVVRSLSELRSASIGP